MTEQKEGIIKNCKTCRYLDEVFGDCCHPKGDGAKNYQPSMDNCLEENNWAWWEGKKNPVKDLLDNIDDGIDLDNERD